MKKTYKACLSSFGKASRGFIMAATLAIMGPGIGYGQTPAPATLPYSDDFSSTGGNWTLLNGTETNVWYVGNANGNTGNSLYITDDGGTTNTYTTSSSASVVQAYRDIVLPAGTNTFNLAFDWECLGEGTSPYFYDYFRIWVVPNTYVPTPGTQITASASGGIQLGGNINDADASTASWHNGNYIIPNTLAGTTARLVFEWKNDGSSGSQPPAAIDNISITEITCSSPTTLTASNVTSGSADIGWAAVAPNPSGGYQYYYSTSNTAPTTVTTPSGSVGVGITAASVTLLTANTQYYFWVRAICSTTDTSAWSTSGTFTTLCATIAAPTSYDVESAAATTNSTIGDCWSSTPSGTTSSYRWNVIGSGGTTPSSSTGPSGPHGGSNYFFTEASSGSTGAEAILTSPMIDVSALTLPTLAFYYHMYGSTMGNLYIEVSNGTTWTTVDSIIGQQQTSSTDPWLQKSVQLTGYTGAIQVRFRAIRGSGIYGDMSLDDISVIEMPTCFSPTQLTVSTVTDASATISWAAPSPAPGNGYEYYYNTTNISPTSSTTALGSVGAATTTAGLTSLSANTQYYVWVRSVCSATDTSAWSTLATFTTLCGSVIAPATYNVESATATTNSTIGDCWSSTPSGTTTSYRWNVVGSGGSTPSSSTGPSGPHSGSKYFYTEASNGSTGAEATLTSPLIDASALTLPSLGFYYHMYGSTMGNLYIEVSNGTTWATVDSIIGQQQTSATDPWLQKSIVLTGYTGTIQVRFRAIRGSNFYGDMSIDDISVVETPTCFSPTQLTVATITDISAAISWTAASPAPANGYEYYYNTTNIAPTNTTVASGSVGAGVTTASLTGLSAVNTYYVWVRSICSATDTSDWSSSATFTTLPTAQIPGTLPYSDDFTSTGGNWTLLNGTETNVWYVGNANGNTGNSLYVTNDGGTTNAYTTSSATSVVQAYRDIILPPGTNSFNLAFDWECLGEGTSPYFYDYFRIWVVPNSYVPTPGTQITALGSGGIQFGADINDAGASSASWHSDSYIIPNTLAGDTVRLVFEWNNDVSSGSQPPAAIDNINVTEITCSAPTALVTSNISTTGATLSWTAPTTAPANGYQYYYSTSNVAPTSSTTASGSVGATIVTAGLTPLTANTQYYVWVRSVCSATDTSDWTGGITFTTLCNSDPIPYTVPLAAVTTPDIPSCMSTQLINTLGSEWYTSNSPGSGFTGKTLVSEYTGFGDGDVDSWVYTNGLLLTGGLSYQIHYRYGNNSTSYAEKLAVKYGTTPDASSMTTLLADHNNIDDATPHDTTVSFTPATTGTYYIGFHAHSIEDQYLLYVDSIMVTLAPCDAAVALTTSNITSSSADLSWTGNAAQYTLEYGSSGFTPGAGTTVSVTGNSYSLGNLDPNNTYDYYVRSICSPGLDSSAYSIAATFTTVCDTVVVALGNDTAICSGSSLILDAGNPTATFVWSDASTAQTLSVSAAGSYYVTATNVYGCSGTDTLTLTINALPVVDLGSDTGICVGDTLSLDAGNSGSTYLWNNASTVQILNATVAGDYYVTVTNTNNCSGSDTLTLTVNALPVLDLGSDTSLCAGDTLSLDAGNAGSTYLWNDASTLQTLQADTTGDYYVMVTDTNGCAATDTFTLTVNALPIVNLGPDTSLCAGDTLTLDAGNPGSAYLWSDTSMLQTLDVFAANDYWVSVTDTNGCSAADTIHLNITLPPSIDSIIVTDNGNGTYTFGVAGAQNVVSYTWDFGDGSALSYSPNPTHTYANTGTDSITVTVIVENECGSDSASVRIPGIGVGIQQVDPGITQLKLYPNPAQDLITVQNESSFKMEAITVYNMLGQVVFQAATRATHHYQLDLSGYASGMYNVRIQLSSGFVMRKFEVLK